MSDPLTYPALAFLSHLHVKFSERRWSLLLERERDARDRRERRAYRFREDTKALREAEWSVASPPVDLQDRRVELAGPAEPKTIINGLNSGARVFIADFEDAMSPTWSHLLEGHAALSSAVRRTLMIPSDTHEPGYALAERLATMMVRIRGLHLTEANFLIRGEAIPAALFDFGLYAFHNAKELSSRGSGAYFYLPKLQSMEEATWWNDVFVETETVLGLATGTIRATILIETLPAVFEMDEILHALKDHAAGLSFGRLDYVFSLIKRLRHDPEWSAPTGATFGTESPFWETCSRLLIETCHRRGAHAIGGVSSVLPNRQDPDLNAKAIARVSMEKRREVLLGFDGTRVAHPDLIAPATWEFDSILGPFPSQKYVRPEPAETLEGIFATEAPAVALTEKGIVANLRSALRSLEKWLAGQGVDSWEGRVEDTATAEVARVQLWHWLHHRAQIGADLLMTPAWLSSKFDEEKRVFHDDREPTWELAWKLLRELVFHPECAEFMTVRADPLLQRLHPKDEPRRPRSTDSQGIVQGNDDFPSPF